MKRPLEKYHLGRYLMDLPFTCHFTKAEWRKLPKKKKKSYVSWDKLKHYSF